MSRHYLSECPICSREETDCFAAARSTGWSKYRYCTILTDSNFGERKCPFYKSKEQREREEKENEKRWRNG